MKYYLLLASILIAQPVSAEKLCNLCPDPAAYLAQLEDEKTVNTKPEQDTSSIKNHNINSVDSSVKIGLDDFYQWKLETRNKSAWAFDLESEQYDVKIRPKAYSVYSGIGGDQLSLPSDWVSASSTKDMPGLNSALKPIKLGLTHRDSSFGLASSTDSKWSFSARLSERESKGIKALGGVIGSTHTNGRSVILPAPVDQSTTNFEIQGNYTGHRDNISIGMRFSEFNNEYQSLIWNNPFSTDIYAPSGSIALAPDNQFAQLELMGAHRYSDQGQISYSMAYGQYLQNQAFQPYSLTQGLSNSTLPRSSLNGELNSLIANLRLTQKFENKLSLNIDYRYHDLDNVTATELYEYVIGDFRNSSIPRSNLIYDFKEQKLSTDMTYPLSQKLGLSGGIKLAQTDRTNQEVKQTNDAGLWGKFNWHIRPLLDISLKTELNHRRSDGYGVIDQLNPAENPLLRKYTFANQDRWNVILSANQQLTQQLHLGFNARVADNSYPDSQIGLSRTKELSVSFDMTYMPNPVWSATLFTGYDNYQSKQLGSADYAVPDWQANIEEGAFSIGSRIDWKPGASRIRHSLDISYINGVSEISINNAPYPKIRSAITRFIYEASYQHSKRLNAMFELWYENYNNDDWATHQISPNTVDRVLSLGDTTLNDHDITAVLGMRYSF
jgi:MtrB/PioB family decaheme-associated outer membrane protein